MSIEHTIVVNWSGPGGGLNSSVAKVAGAERNVSEPIPSSSTDLLVGFALDVSECSMFYIKSDQNCTVKTNSSSVPDDTLTLLAGIPYAWHEDMPDAFQLGTDVTALYVTDDSGGNNATLEIRSLSDPTP